MGRHAAPDDEPDDGAPTALAVTGEAPSGRHHAPAPDDTEPDDTEPDNPEPDDTEPDDTERPSGAEVRERPTQADLRLLREQPALRARCVAAVVVPFLIYTVVLFAIDRVASYVFWLWVPIIVAGVLLGVLLDAAHKKVGGS